MPAPKKTGFTLMSLLLSSDKRSYKGKTGFTLIELLIAITIVAILATVGLVIYSAVQKNARVSKRVQDLNAIKTALETYKTAVGFYPSTGTAIGAFECIGNSVTTSSKLAPNYMPVTPADPLDGNDNGASAPNCYEYASNASSAVAESKSTEYKVRTKATISTSGEMSSDNFATQPTLIDPAKDGTVDCTVQKGTTEVPVTYTGWAVYSGTAACAY